MSGKPFFFTETAAKILEDQGYRAKAAEVYLYLSINSQEKKDYYRARFERLESDLVWIKKNKELVRLFHLWIVNLNCPNRIERLTEVRTKLLERKKNTEFKKQIV